MFDISGLEATKAQDQSGEGKEAKNDEGAATEAEENGPWF
jgi:hypothetical protein